MKRRDLLAGLALLPLASCGGMHPAFAKAPRMWNVLSRSWAANWEQVQIGDIVYTYTAVYRVENKRADYLNLIKMNNHKCEKKYGYFIARPGASGA